MELIERYLQAVRFALPVSQRDDIVKELRDSILSQVEAKEAEVGRPINEDEQVALLKKMGSPLRLASGYSRPRQVIGPGTFPIYWKVLVTSLALAFVGEAVGSIVTAALGHTLSDSLAVIFQFPHTFLMVFASITLTFWALEYFGAKLCLADRWDPRKLPALSRTNPQKPRFELVTRLLVQTIFAVWWLVGLHYQYLILGPGRAFLKFGPIWLQIYWVFVLMALIDLGLTSARLVRPQWTQAVRVSRITMNSLGLLVLFFLLTHPPMFVAADPANPQLTSLAGTINNGVRIGVLVAAVINIVNIAMGAICSPGEKSAMGCSKIRDL